MNKKEFSPLRIERRQSLTGAAAERLRKAILEGELQQGQHLVEIETAEKLGISRGPLREAFKLLAAEGLLEIRQERGVFVPKHSDEEVEQMIIARAMIEGTAARLFVLRADEQTRARLSDLLAAMEIEAERADTSAWREIDWKFHETVLVGSGNPFLRRAWATIGTLLRVYMMQMNPLYDQQRAQAMENHRRLVKVLLADDPAQAEVQFRQTILRTGYFVLGRLPPAGLVDGNAGQGDA
jgi:DNA-binding GntR family transcriptional regulator